MESIYLETEDFYPGVIFDKGTSTFKIFGTSCPSDAIKFYKPLLDWIEEYKKGPLPSTFFDLHLNYFNTASGKMIIQILKKLKELEEEDNDVIVRWFYDEDDEDMRDEGEEFQSLLKLKFVYIALEEDDER